MQCASPLTEEEIRAFHLGDLPPQRLAEVAAHLEVCGFCEAAAAKLDTVTDAVIEALQQPSPLLAALRERVATVSQANRPPQNRSRAIGDLGPLEPPTPIPDEFHFLAPAQGPDEIGRLAHFRVLRKLGQGGMGVVFEAEDSHLQRRVALKVMKPGTANVPGIRQRFLREARTMAVLPSQHIVTVYEVGQDRDVPFLSMELLSGQSLEQRLASGSPLPLAHVLQIGREVALGLAAAHDSGMVHRDIKPSNIWLVPQSSRVGEESFQAKILDFGLARVRSDSVGLTLSGYVVGTPAYMAPEQGRGQPVDARADLFSLGCVLYRLLSGELPFPGSSTMAMLVALAVSEPRPLRQLNPDLPPALEQLVSRLLAKNPEDRPASAGEVAESLAAIAGALPTHPPATAAMPVAASGHGLPWWTWIVAGLLGLALAVGLLALFGTFTE